MHFSFILLFIFVYIIKLNCAFLKKSKETLENYVIDILFTNSLTIIICSPYERQVIRDITIEKVGVIKCSNRNSFLPDNHIESLTLLQWNKTVIECSKAKKNVQEIKTERTYLNVKHKAKNAFKKSSLELTRIGSTGPSKLNWLDKHSKVFFEHPPRKLPTGNIEPKNANFSTEIFLFKHRPILCREQRSSTNEPCSTANQKANFSYLCYYRIGVPEPPTVADLEKELKRLPDVMNADADADIDLYVDKTPEEKSSLNIFLILGIFIVIIVISIIGVSAYCCCNRRRRSGTNKQNGKIVHADSDSSMASNAS